MRDILERVKNGKISIAEAERELRLHELTRLGERLKLDLNREQRTGIPECVYARGKDVDTILKASKELVRANEFALVTKLVPRTWRKIRKKLPQSVTSEYTPEGQTLILKRRGFEHSPLIGKIGIVTAGTSDIPVAKEIKAICTALGGSVTTKYDVGIASLDRTFTAAEEMIKERVNIIIAIAGMEGSLPSVLSSIVEIPIIGVPVDTSSAGNENPPALTMFNTCSPGLSVVKDGFRAATFAVLILRQATKICESSTEH